MDAELFATGIVSAALYFRLDDAYGYGAASTVGWVEAKLRVLANRLATGASLSLYRPQDGRFVSCSSIDELQSWASALFPGVVVTGT
ncbi:hypothetical protein D3260_15770 [Salinisphaera sp. Q1T1-3]|nr:hypothetical protein D3260_15770 [Salinisphaera sp. Q1T1-3]